MGSTRSYQKPEVVTYRGGDLADSLGPAQGLSSGIEIGLLPDEGPHACGGKKGKGHHGH